MALQSRFLCVIGSFMVVANAGMSVIGNTVYNKKYISCASIDCNRKSLEYFQAFKFSSLLPQILPTVDSRHFLVIFNN